MFIFNSMPGLFSRNFLFLNNEARVLTGHNSLTLKTKSLVVTRQQTVYYIDTFYFFVSVNTIIHAPEKQSTRLGEY